MLVYVYNSITTSRNDKTFLVSIRLEELKRHLMGGFTSHEVVHSVILHVSFIFRL